MLRRVVLAVIFLWGGIRITAAQDLLNDTIPFSGLTLDLVEYAQLPTPDRAVLSLSSPSFDDRLYVSASSGRIYVIDENQEGNQATLWFDAAAAIRNATGRALNFTNAAHGGLRSFAFHPEFETNGKLYLSVMEERPSDPSGHHYLGASESNVAADSALVEFTYDFATNQVDSGSYRELFRVSMPFYDHPIKQIKFNKFATPGDDDYGLLYVTHGDASVQSAIAGGGQNRDDALGKVLRIDPLEVEDAPYTTPFSPFAHDEDALNEIFAIGFRNPHNLSFALDANDRAHLIVADIGRDNVEEVNIVEAGSDYGWSSREGTFVHNNGGGGYIDGVSPLPENEVEHGYTYPVAMFDHDSRQGQGFAGIAIAGGHVIANRSALHGEYVFGEFASTGKLYHATYEDMLAATTSLDRTDPTRDEPDELTQASIAQLRLRFDHDGNPETPLQVFDSFTEMLNNRTDLRFGEGSHGEIFLSSKRNGRVYLATNSVSDFYRYDLNGDVRVDARDLDLLASLLGGFPDERRWDLDGDGSVSFADVEFIVTGPLETSVGDANLDGVVDFADFLVLSASFGLAGGWAQGDFDGSQTVDFADFLRLSANFEGSVAAAPSVPEPHADLPLLLMLLVVTNLRPRRSRGRSAG